MKNNRLVSTTVAGMLCITGILGLASPARATVTFNNTIPFVAGSGNSSNGWTTATANGLALSLRAQYNNTPAATAIINANSLTISQLTPNDGAGTFTFATGTPTRAVWDFWFDVNPGATSTTGDTFTLTINSSLGGSPVSFPADFFLLGNASNGTEFQNAEDIGFAFLGYNPSLNATYNFNLTAKDAAGNTLDSVDMTVINGTPVPEPTTVIAGALLLLPFGASALRKLRKNRAV